MNLDLFKKKNKAYKEVFSTEAGKIVLADIYRVTKINHPSYVDNNRDRTTYNEGAKFVAYYIRDQLNQNLEDIIKILEGTKLINNPKK